jgi:hypothetical protein
LTATEFEPLGELEDEFEEEAAELEPFLSRGKPIPVARPARWTPYSPLDVRALETWASKVPKTRFFVLYSQKAVGGGAVSLA